jgi:hypothetical protein
MLPERGCPVAAIPIPVRAATLSMSFPNRHGAGRDDRPSPFRAAVQSQEDFGRLAISNPSFETTQSIGSKDGARPAILSKAGSGKLPSSSMWIDAIFLLRQCCGRQILAKQ